MEKYSVLMSVYYKEKAEYFLAAVESMLSQTVPPDEFVLVCDGKLTMELDSVIEKLEKENPNLFQIIRLEKNEGLGRALAIGLRSCKNDIVARMDSDDIAVPERMQWQISFLQKNPTISAVGGHIQEFNEQIEKKVGYRCVPVGNAEIRKIVAYKNPMNHMTVTFRKKDILSVGNYKHFDKFEDYYLWARLLKKGYLLDNLDMICVYARVNDEMYMRRAGMPYFKQTVKMEQYLLNSGLINKKQYCRNLCIRFFGVVVVPNWLRRFLYNKVMRKKEM